MIADIIHKIAQEIAEDEYDFYPRPSSAGPERCIRQMVYHGLKVPREPLPGRALIIFSDSSFHEDLTADWIRKSAFHLHSEQMKVKCRPPMKDGAIDGIITDPLGVDRLYEHKGISHFSYQRYWGGELPLDYLTQCSVYIDALQKDAPDLKEGILLIKNKNTAQYMEFEIEYTPQDSLLVKRAIDSTGEVKKIDQELPCIVQAACDKFNQVLEFIKNKTLPKRQYDYNSWRCEYCGWGQICYKNYEQEFKELKTDTDLPTEIADTVRYYKETGAHIKEMEKENEARKKDILAILKKAGAREGRAGEYLLKLSLIKSKGIDKSLLTPAEVKKATRESWSERLFISKAKEKKGG